MAHFSEGSIRSAVSAVLAELRPELDASGPLADSLARYAGALARFGAHTDLVGAHTAEGLVELAVADSLVIARRPDLLHAPTWEIGAGGASLTVPLALERDSLRGTLIEPRQKRATFLRMAIGALGLASRLTVQQTRVEPSRAPVGIAGCALGRAVFAPDVWIPMAARVVEAGNAFPVLTTDDVTVPPGFRTVAIEKYALPFSRAVRTATWVAAE